MKVYIVIELHKENPPAILGVYTSKEKAEAVAYKDTAAWRNVIEKTLEN